MPKKITIVSGIALLMLVTIIIIMLSAASRKPFSPPEKVSVYLPESSEIVTVPYEQFLAVCINELIPESIGCFPETLKAVAVAVNSRAMYALHTKKGFQNLGADFTVNSDFPFDPDIQPAESIYEAVGSGMSMLLTYEDEPINAQMCVISSGATDDCPPISPSVALPCDIGAYGYESRCAYTPDEVRRALQGRTPVSENCAEWLHNAVYADNGTLLYISFCEDKITGTTLKNALRLRSTAITAEYTEDKFYFTCLGSGENKGMSVNAANFLSQSGSTAEEILNVFYPGANLAKIR